jgi:hypothetical protein
LEVIVASKSFDLKMRLDISQYMKELKASGKYTESQITRLAVAQQKSNVEQLRLRVVQEKKAAKASAGAWKDIYGAALQGLSIAAIGQLVGQFTSLGQEVADLRNELADTATNWNVGGGVRCSATRHQRRRLRVL